jgi:hypothetical protein
MPATETAVANLALSKLSIGRITNIDTVGDGTTTEEKCKVLLPACRQGVVEEFASMDAPFRETLKYTDLGDDLKDSDIEISNISVGAGPTYTVTITTEDDHGLTTGDKRFLLGIVGDGGITSLNNKVYTITDTGDKTLTLDSTTGSADWVYTERGRLSLAPNIGEWQHAFNLPTDFYCMSKQIRPEHCFVRRCEQEKYPFAVILNKEGTGKILLTNNLTNRSHTSAFVEYCIDPTDPTMWSQSLTNCVVTIMAAELSPALVTSEGGKRRYFIGQEYLTIVMPNAKRFNLSQEQEPISKGTNYLGGRTPLTFSRHRWDAFP